MHDIAALPNPLQVVAPASRVLIIVVGLADSASILIKRSYTRLSSAILPKEEDDFQKCLPSTSVCVMYDSII